MEYLERKIVNSRADKENSAIDNILIAAESMALHDENMKSESEFLLLQGIKIRYGKQQFWCANNSFRGIDIHLKLEHEWIDKKSPSGDTNGLETPGK